MTILIIWLICFAISWWLAETLLNHANRYTGYNERNLPWRSCWEEAQVKPWAVPIAMLLLLILAPLAVIILFVIYLLER